jgi:gamma-glutamylputrescine oxidase
MTTTSYWLHTPQNSGKHQTDVLIVGAGITGLSLAYWLKKISPHTKVSIVDEGNFGRGATGRNAGFNTAGSTHYLAHLLQKHGEAHARTLWAFKQDSLRLMREEIFSRLECGFQQWGSYTLYRDQARMDEHASVVARLHEGSCPQVSGADLQTRGLTGFAGALTFAHEACLSPKLFLEQLSSLLKSQGVEFFLNEKILWAENQSWIGTRRSFSASQTFLALNGYLPRFDKNLTWVAPKRAQMVALDFNHNKLSGNYYDPDHKVYFRADPLAATSTLLVGGMRLLEEATENDDEDKVSAVIQHALQHYAESLFTQKFQVRARWSGVMGFSSNELPFMRDLAGLKNCRFVGGYSGHGMGMAFGVARVAVLKALGQACAEEHLLQGDQG